MTTGAPKTPEPEPEVVSFPLHSMSIKDGRVLDMVYHPGWYALVFALSSPASIWREEGPERRFRRLTSSKEGCKDGRYHKARFKRPSALAVHPRDGSIWISDSMNGRIRRMYNGCVETVAGSGSHEMTDCNTSAMSAGFAYPDSITISLQGIVYVLDRVGRQPYVRILTPTTDNQVTNGTTMTYTVMTVSCPLSHPTRCVSTNLIRGAGATLCFLGWQRRSGVSHDGSQSMVFGMKTDDLMNSETGFTHVHPLCSFSDKCGSPAKAISIFPNGAIGICCRDLSAILIFDPTTEQQISIMLTTRSDMYVYEHTALAVNARGRCLYVSSNATSNQLLTQINHLPNHNELFACPSMLVNWRRVAILMAFIRANLGHPFRNSILPLVRYIGSLLPGPGCA